ncbi:MAG: plasma membrane fusion protein prm1 [Candelina submexicana]|nr:MAG: plasma membrane fusion protein prm1 [Candelina submexicana]
MSSARNQPPSAFPAVPPSLSAGDHEMRDYYATQNPPRAVPHTAPEFTPYLGLRGRLSQVWINRWTILLLLVLVRTILAAVGINHDLTSAKREALSACTGVESMGSAMASMPHYMSQGVNEMAASGVEKAVNGLMSMLLLSVTAVEEIIVFYINMLTSTYVCLITLAISGSLHVALKVVEDVGDFLNKTLGDIGRDIHSGIDDFQKDLNKFTGTLNSIPKAFGSDSSIPKLNVDGSLNKLDNIKLPGSLDEGLAKLNSSIPNFAQVNNFTNNAIRFPFEEVKKLMNESMVAFKFDRSVFPVPQKEQVSFCSDNNGIAQFFDKLFRLVAKARTTFTVVVLILAILVCIPMAFREVKRWQTMQKRAQLLSQNSFDPIDVVQIASRPYSSTIGIKAASRFKSPRRQILVRWCVSYATSVPALFVLSLGLAGLLACLFQYILLKVLEKEVPALANEVGDFAGKVVGILNNASEQWAIGTNRVIDTTNDDINKEVFGWVNTTTGAVNKTLNVFVNEMTTALNTTFGGTVLYDPIMEVLNCLILLKIQGIEKGLTWVSDHAHVDFPNLANDTFSLGAAASIASDSKDAGDSFLANPSSKAADQITDIVVSLADRIADGIRTEAIISACVVGVWFIVVLIGIIHALLNFFGRDKMRGEGGPVYADQVRDGFAAPSERVISPEQAHGFPKFGEPSPYESAAKEAAWQDEKLGFAGERNGAPVRKGFERASSYGYVVDDKRG